MTDSTWAPPMAFYFKVNFQGGVQCTIPFSEVSGLDIKWEIDKNKETGQRYLTKTTHPDLTLKRALAPLSDSFSKWVKDCFDVNKIPVKCCNIIISLINEKKEIVASWTCFNAYPKEWSISTFNAMEGKLVMETLVLDYDFLERG